MLPARHFGCGAARTRVGESVKTRFFAPQRPDTPRGEGADALTQKNSFVQIKAGNNLLLGLMLETAPHPAKGHGLLPYSGHNSPVWARGTASGLREDTSPGRRKLPQEPLCIVVMTRWCHWSEFSVKSNPAIFWSHSAVVTRPTLQQPDIPVTGNTVRTAFRCHDFHSGWCSRLLVCLAVSFPASRVSGERIHYWK